MRLKLITLLFMSAFFLVGMADAQTLTSDDGIWSFTVTSGTQDATILPVDNTLSAYTVPATVRATGTTDDYAVKAIDRNAFKNNTSLVSIDFSQATSLELIGPSAFEGCTSLTAVSFPASLRYIGNRNGQNGENLGASFRGCTSLQTVTFAEGSHLDVLGAYSFYGCSSLKSLYFPDPSQDVILIFGSRLVEECTALESLSFPSRCNISSGYSGSYPEMLQGCTSLKRLEFRAGEAFLTKIIDGIASTKATLEYLDLRGTKWEFIGNSKFKGFTKLTTVYLPNSLKELYKEAFSGCTALTTVNLPEGLEKIHNAVFLGTAISSIAIPCTVKKLGVIGNNTGDGVFKDCTSLTSVTFAYPSSVDTIGYQCFRNCTSLTGFDFPRSTADRDTTLDVGEGIFSGCLLTNVNISRKLMRFPSNSLVLPKTTLETITWEDGAYHFPSLENCQLLTSVDMSNTAITYMSGKPVKNQSTGKITYYPSNVGFRNCPNLEVIQFSPMLQYIGEYCIKNLPKFKRAVLPSTVREIDSWNFSSCPALEYFEIEGPANNTVIQPYSIIDCPLLATIILPEGVQQLAGANFGGCNALEEISFPKTLTNAGSHQFLGYDLDWNELGCPNLKRIIFNRECDLTRNGRLLPTEFANGLPSLEYIQLPSRLTGFDVNAITNCPKLATVVMPETGLTTFSTNFLANCPLIQSITIPEGVTTIRRGFLQNNVSIASLTIPSSVKTIEAECFLSGCSNLRELYLNCPPTVLKTTGILNGSTLKDDCTRPFATNTYYNFDDENPWFFEQDKLKLPEGTICTHLNNCVIYIKDEPLHQQFMDAEFTVLDPISNEEKTVNLWSRLDEDSEYNMYGWENANFDYYGEDVTLDNTEGLAYLYHLYFDSECGYDFSEGYNNRYQYAKPVGLQFDATSMTATLDGGLDGDEPSVAFTKEQPEDQSVTYVSSNPDVASVDEQGNVTVHDGGTAQIMAIYAGVPYYYMPDTASYTVTVAPPESIVLNIGQTGYATFAAGYPLDFTQFTNKQEPDFQVYVVSSYNQSKVMIVEVKDPVMGNTGLLIKGTPGQYTIPVAETGSQYGNLLKSAAYTTFVPKVDDNGFTNMVLGNGSNGIGFYTITNSGNIGPRKAYLHVIVAAAEAAGNFFQLPFDDEENTDGIADTFVEETNDTDEWYNLQGVRIQRPTQPGLYIHNGKKVAVN